MVSSQFLCELCVGLSVGPVQSSRVDDQTIRRCGFAIWPMPNLCSAMCEPGYCSGARATILAAPDPECVRHPMSGRTENRRSPRLSLRVVSKGRRLRVHSLQPTIEKNLSICLHVGCRLPKNKNCDLQPPVSYRRRNVAWIKDALDVDQDALFLIAKRLQ